MKTSSPLPKSFRNLRRNPVYRFNIFRCLSNFACEASGVYRSNSITGRVREIVLDWERYWRFFMRSRTHMYSLAVIVLLTLGRVAFSTASPFAYGLIQSSCAPWDGPAIGITLTAEPAKVRTSEGAVHQHGSLAWASHSCRPNREVRQWFRRGLRVALCQGG